MLIKIRFMRNLNTIFLLVIISIVVLMVLSCSKKEESSELDIEIVFNTEKEFTKLETPVDTTLLNDESASKNQAIKIKPKIWIDFNVKECNNQIHISDSLNIPLSFHPLIKEFLYSIFINDTGCDSLLSYETQLYQFGNTTHYITLVNYIFSEEEFLENKSVHSSSSWKELYGNLITSMPNRKAQKKALNQLLKDKKYESLSKIWILDFNINEFSNFDSFLDYVVSQKNSYVLAKVTILLKRSNSLHQYQYCMELLKKSNEELHSKILEYIRVDNNIYDLGLYMEMVYY